MTRSILNLWPQAIGYAYAVFVAQVFTWPIINRMWTDLGIPRAVRPRHWQSVLLGMVERTLFVASLQAAKPEFIGIWLALKVAGQWQRWSEDKPHQLGGPVIVGREVFNIFLMGSALSIAYSVVGAKAIDWLTADKWTLGVGIPILLLVASGILWAAVRKYTKDSSL